MESERMTRVMGIVNVTPDSFSDGGKYFRPKEAVRRALNLIDEGADIIDIGAESTRPGSVPISWEEEWSRLEPVLKGLSPRCLSRRKGLSPQSVSVQSDIDDRADLLQKDNFAKNKDKHSVVTEGSVPISAVPEGSVPISVDTYHPETARLAVESGASIINCVYPEPVEEMLEILRENPNVELVMPVSAFGMAGEDLLSRIYIDPMIGFGTTREEDLELLRSVPELAKKARVLVGASRKRLVKKLTGEKVTGKNLGGNLGIAVWAAMNGASVVRVHDVRETFQALKVIGAICGRICG
ncbi:MAG: dihydropteroate synthase [Kiritimatiellae bacterium]|nr:dihydropteroate synthase [Kiritimatiellia bacterium]MBR3821446.1 dihydropteroate synthase [Kiritimatiellia bacterium]